MDQGFSSSNLKTNSSIEVGVCMYILYVLTEICGWMGVIFRLSLGYCTQGQRKGSNELPFCAFGKPCSKSESGVLPD